jgi:hypothetical protein
MYSKIGTYGGDGKLPKYSKSEILLNGIST